MRENFGVTLDAWQEQALNCLRPDKPVKRLAMKACAGPGKSAVIAWAGLWKLSCFAEKGEHPKGIALSITGDNLSDNLWPELSKWMARSPFLSTAFEWQKERIYAKDHPETWFLSARAFAKTANAEEQGRTISGLHSRFPFVLLDESGDMATAIGRAAEQAMGGAQAGMIVQGGNTTSMTGLLYDSAVNRADLWDVVSITADPDDPNRTPRVDAEWARKQIADYGRDNPWVMSFVLGKFPPGGMNSLLTLDEVETAMKRVLTARDIGFASKVLGIDVARFGDDRNVLFPRHGRVAYMPTIMRNATTSQIAARAARAMQTWKADAAMVDGTGGYGAGVIDQMRNAGLTVFEVQFAGKADDDRYFNKRSEMWFLAAEHIKSGGALPDVPDLKRELTAPTYYFQNGKLRLEEKEQIKKRLGFSPDIADGYVLTFAVPIQPRIDLQTAVAAQKQGLDLADLAALAGGRSRRAISEDMGEDDQ